MNIVKSKTLSTKALRAAHELVVAGVAEEQDAQRAALITSGLSPHEARTRVLQKGRHALPDETYVVDLASLWSINPLRLSKKDHPSGLGMAVRLPKDLAQ